MSIPRIFSIIVYALAVISTAGAKAEPVTIFAAASLTSVITEAADQFQTETGAKIRLSFASSSTLARQIEAGAPADLYFSANVKWMDYLTEKGLIKTETQTRQISNQLVLIAPAELGLDPIAELNAGAIHKILGDDGLLAMGDPDHVPVGIYGKSAMDQLGLWTVIRHRIARGDNTLAALALVARGETPLGIVYKTDANNQARINILYAFKTNHNPIAYALARTRQSINVDADRFYSFLIGDKGMALFEKYGFLAQKG